MLGVVAALALTPAGTHAHSGPPPTPETLWSTWNFDPFIITVLLLAVWAYIRGVRRIWSKAGRNRGVPYIQVAAALGGYLALAIALISPLDPLGSALFTGHMAQHMMLITVAAPLLIIGNVSAPILWSLPPSWRRTVPAIWRGAGPLRLVWNEMSRPLSVLLIHGAVLWAWHVPVLYNAAIRNEFIHILEHLTMFGSAVLFWWLLIQRGRQHGLSYGLGLFVLFGIVLQKTVLGALITFSQTPWYSEHATTTAAWGLTPLEDQVLAGVVMMVPGGMVYLIAGVVLFATWIQAIERTVDRHERLTVGYRPDAPDTSGRAKETV